MVTDLHTFLQLAQTLGNTNMLFLSTNENINSNISGGIFEKCMAGVYDDKILIPSF